MIAAARDDDVLVRGFACAALSRLGERGADAAADRLVSGDWALADLPGLASASMRGGRRVEVLTSLRHPTAILACCAALRGTDLSRDAVADVLPQVVAPVLDSAEGQDVIGFAADALVTAGRFDALIAIAGSSERPPAARSEALDRAVRYSPTPDDVLAGVLASDDLSSDVLADLLRRIGDRLREPRFAGLLADRARTARDPWVREDARRAQQTLRPADAGDLRIESARYGGDERWIDATAALRELVAGGRLDLTVSNDLVGDPAFGIVKTLEVTYTYRGRRFARSFREHGPMRLP